MKTFRNVLLGFILLLSFATYAENIDINTADVKALAKNIKGIGDKKAQAIVDYRTEHGNFTAVEELTKVKGIGKKIVDKNKASLFVKAE